MSMPNFTRDDILMAIKYMNNMDQNDIKQPTKYELIYEGKRYAPKEVLRYANLNLNNEILQGHSGGDETNNVLIKLGFTIVLMGTNTEIGMNYTVKKRQGINKEYELNLPSVFQNLFKNKQKSYKMVLMLSYLDEISGDIHKRIPIRTVRQSFLEFYQQRESEGRSIDPLPPHLGKTSWNEADEKDIVSMFLTPVNVLNSVLFYDTILQTIQFHKDIIDKLNSEILEELRSYAQKELINYFSSNGIPLRTHLMKIMDHYLKAKNENFKGHELANYMRQTIPLDIQKLSFIHEEFKVQGSVGQGNWARNPWIAILNKNITSSTQYGEYIVYLFSDDLKTVYLTLAQGVTIPIQEKGRPKAYQYLEEKTKQIRKVLPLKDMQKDDQIYLSSDGLGRDYQVSTVAYIRYDREHLPENEKLISDLQEIVKNYDAYAQSSGNKIVEQVKHSMNDNDIKKTIIQIQNYISQKGFNYPHYLIENFYLSLKTKPFVVLAGVSGTGKTKLVELFAEAIGANKDNQQYTLISVRPDWSDPSDLLGFQDLSGRFRSGKLTEILLKASQPENRNHPYFICLDEMNLARVEHYFSDLLSIMETQKWQGENITSQKLISDETLIKEEDRQIYGGLTFQDNVYIIGTVNMDETTHPFSKKVLDRANTIEFNYIDLTQFPDTSNQHENSIELSNRFFRNEYLQLIDAYKEHTGLIKKTTDNLVQINRILEPIHSQVGFRIRDNVCFYLIYNKRFQLMSENEAFDMQLLQKILPRIQGSHLAVKKALLQLIDLCLDDKIDAEVYIDDATDLYSRWDPGKALPTSHYPLSAMKIIFMLRRLEEDGFTSYWLT